MDYSQLPFSKSQPNVYSDILVDRPIIGVQSYDGVTTGTDLAVQVLIATSAAWEQYLMLPPEVRAWDRKSLARVQEVIQNADKDN